MKTILLSLLLIISVPFIVNSQTVDCYQTQSGRQCSSDWIVVPQNSPDMQDQKIRVAYIERTNAFYLAVGGSSKDRHWDNLEYGTLTVDGVRYQVDFLNIQRKTKDSRYFQTRIILFGRAKMKEMRDSSSASLTIANDRFNFTPEVKKAISNLLSRS